MSVIIFYIFFILFFVPLIYGQISMKDYQNLVLKARMYERRTIGDSVYFRLHPERFADEIIGRDVMRQISTLNEFNGFTDFQIAFMVDYLSETVPRVFIRCSRGGAKSFLLGYCSLLDSYIHHCEGRMWHSVILSGSSKQAYVSFKYARKMATMSPILQNMIDDTMTSILFPSTFCEIICLSASDKNVKGPRANVQIIDEVCSTDEQIIEDFWGEMITAQKFKAIVSGTPDDPSHISYRWEHDDSYGYKVHHWSAYDCLTENGGWLTREVVEDMERQYRSIHAIRRNILGEWASYGGSVIPQEYIEAATQNFTEVDLPDLTRLDYVIVCGDPARSGHYSTLITIGIYKNKAYVFRARGWQQIIEKKLRKRYMDEARKYARVLNVMGKSRVIVVLEDVPISKTLCDNVEVACSREGILFRRSRFGSESDNYMANSQRGRPMKNRFVENLCWFFEDELIKIPLSCVDMIGQLIAFRWKKMPGKTDDLTTGKVKKGDDDYVDALMHGLMEASRYIAYKKRDDKYAISIVSSENKHNIHKIKEMRAQKKNIGTFCVIRHRQQNRF